MKLHWKVQFHNIKIVFILGPTSSAAFLRKIHTRHFGSLDGTSPCDLLLQLGNTGYIKHHSKVNGGLLPILVQLLFQWLLQVNPSLLVLLVWVPQAEICYLKGIQRICKYDWWTKVWWSTHLQRVMHAVWGAGKGLCDIWININISEVPPLKENLFPQVIKFDRTLVQFQLMNDRTTWFETWFTTTLMPLKTNTARHMLE